MTTWYREWASSVKARKGRMLTLKALDTILKYHDPGYASVYMFKEEDAKLLSDAESSKGMKRFEVAADRITLDIDKGIDGLATVGRKLEKAGIAFDVWESGGKGYHIEIKHQFVSDKRVPYSQRAAVEALLGSDVEQIDLTLYQHGRLLSLPGRVHPVTKKKKILLFKAQGRSIELTLVDEPVKEIANFSMTNDNSLLSAALFRVADLANTEPGKGQRHVSLWGAAKNLAEAGLDFDTTSGLISKVNESWEHPKPDTEVLQAVKSAFQR